MKKLLLCIIFLFVTIISSGQSGKNNFLQKPEFPGGVEAMSIWLSEHIRYPERALRSSITGTVRVSFVVNKDGSISNVDIPRPNSFQLDEEAKRVVSSMPKWKPARYKGKAIPYAYVVPIRFMLQ